MIVLDASVVVEMLLNRPLGALVRESLAIGEESLATPHIMDIEPARAFSVSIVATTTYRCCHRSIGANLTKSVSAVTHSQPYSMASAA